MWEKENGRRIIVLSGSLWKQKKGLQSIFIEGFLVPCSWLLLFLQVSFIYWLQNSCKGQYLFSLSFTTNPFKSNMNFQHVSMFTSSSQGFHPGWWKCSGLQECVKSRSIVLTQLTALSRQCSRLHTRCDISFHPLMNFLCLYLPCWHTDRSWYWSCSVSCAVLNGSASFGAWTFSYPLPL